MYLGSSITTSKLVDYRSEFTHTLTKLSRSWPQYDINADHCIPISIAYPRAPVIPDITKLIHLFCAICEEFTTGRKIVRALRAIASTEDLPWLSPLLFEARKYYVLLGGNGREGIFLKWYVPLIPTCLLSNKATRNDMKPYWVDWSLSPHKICINLMDALQWYLLRGAPYESTADGAETYQEALNACKSLDIDDAGSRTAATTPVADSDCGDTNAGSVGARTPQRPRHAERDHHRSSTPRPSVRVPDAAPGRSRHTSRHSPTTPRHHTGPPVEVLSDDESIPSPRTPAQEDGGSSASRRSHTPLTGDGSSSGRSASRPKNTSPSASSPSDISLAHTGDVIDHHDANPRANLQSCQTCH